MPTRTRWICPSPFTFDGFVPKDEISIPISWLKRLIEQADFAEEREKQGKTINSASMNVLLGYISSAKDFINLSK